jgi:hypothetical protein
MVEVGKDSLINPLTQKYPVNEIGKYKGASNTMETHSCTKFKQSTNTSTTSIRSNIMDALQSITNPMRAVMVFLAVAVFSSLALSQSVVITNNTVVNASTGRINIKGNLIDSSTSAKTIHGTVVFNGTSDTLGKLGTQGVLIDSLVDSTTTTVLLGESATVNDSLALRTGTLTVGGKALTIGGKTIRSAGASLTANGGSDSVAYTSTGSLASGPFTQGLIDSATYTKLTLSGAGAKSISTVSTTGVTATTVSQSGGGLTVNNDFTVTGTGTLGILTDLTDTLQFTGTGTSTIATVSTLSTASGAILNGSTGTLTVTTLSGNSAGTINATSGDINFTTATNGAGTIETATKNLTFNAVAGNSGTIKTTGAGAISVTTTTSNSGTIQSTGAGGNLLFTGNATNTGTISSSNTGTITFDGTLANNTAGAHVTGGSGAVTFGNASTDTVYNTLGNITAGTGVVTFTGVPVNTGTITAGTGDSLSFATAVTNSSGTISLTGTGRAAFNADFTSLGSLTLANTSTVNLQGTTTTIPLTTYGNLTLGGSSDKSGTGNFTVVGNLSLANRKITMAASTDTLIMTSATGTNVTSSGGEVDGIVKRTVAVGQFFSFNRDSVGVILNSAKTIAVKMEPNTTIGSTNLGQKYVDRAYTIGVVGGSFASTDSLRELSLIYADAELTSGLQPATLANVDKLRAKSHSSSSEQWSKVNNLQNGQVYDHTIDSTSHVVDLTNLSSPLQYVDTLALSAVAFQSIASGNWSAGTTWDEGTSPGASDDVELDASWVVTNDQASQQASSITFYSTSQLVISHTLSVGGLVDVNSPSSTLSIGTGNTLTITPGSGNVGLHLNGILTNNGTIVIQ